MKKTKIISLLLLFALCFPLKATAVTKNITITWSMADTSNVTGYKMYYSYASDMAGKILACETGNPSATTLTCLNINLLQSPVYFSIAATTVDSEIVSTTKSQTFTDISIVQGFQVEVNTNGGN